MAKPAWPNEHPHHEAGNEFGIRAGGRKRDDKSRLPGTRLSPLDFC